MTITRKPLEIKAIFIAHTGADKMDRLGYKMEIDARFATKATVTTPEGKKYTLNVGPQFRYCGCPYHLENRICKHLVWAGRKMGDIAEDDYDLEIRAQEAEERYYAAQHAHAEYLETLEQ